MRKIIWCLYLLTASHAAGFTQELPVMDKQPLFQGDWLVEPVAQRAGVYFADTSKKDIVLTNGLVKRVFRISPNLACIEFKNLTNNQSLIRALRPEAVLVINQQRVNVGGLWGQKEQAFLQQEALDALQGNEADLKYTGYQVKNIDPLVPQYQQKPAGKELVLFFSNPDSIHLPLTVSVHYALYDGVPLLAKWVKLVNKGAAPIIVNQIKNEVLAMVEEESAVVGKPEQMKKPQGLYIETNYAFNNAMRYSISDQTTHWKTDSSYTSQVNYNFETPCVLEVYPDKVTAIKLQSGDSLESVKSFELLMDSDDRERRGLAVRKMYRKIAPWVTENPIFMHLVSRNDEEVYEAINQCAETGYEALILSFGSHLNMEDTSAANIQRWKNMADSARKRGVRMGGYSLFSSRKISEEDDVVNPLTGKTGGAFFGNAPCFGSVWGLAYRDKIKYFFEKTGFTIWENDGPYPGDVCASTTHPGHTGLDDSQWKQMEIQKELYRWLNQRGVYINAPDWYFLDGTHKIAIGYREVNFSLPRENQKILNRQNIYDGTWEKTPSMGWGFVPLVKYQGGGPEAILEPLEEHLADYKQLMMQYYGAGVQACYRGPRLYDTDSTRQTVIQVIQWYKKYRDILNADLIHLRRADARDWDGWLHVDPKLKNKGLFMLFNPTKDTITRTIRIPLYYTGLTYSVKIREQEGGSKEYRMNRNYEVEFNFTLPPGGYSWYVVD